MSKQILLARAGIIVTPIANGFIISEIGDTLGLTEHYFKTWREALEYLAYLGDERLLTPRIIAFILADALTCAFDLEWWQLLWNGLQ